MISKSLVAMFRLRGDYGTCSEKCGVRILFRQILILDDKGVVIAKNIHGKALEKKSWHG